MKAIVHDLVAALAKLDPRPDPKFRGPAQREAIRRAQVELGVAFDNDLVEYLMCVDGQETDGSAAPFSFLGDPIVPMFRFGPEPVQFTGWGWLLGVEKIVEATLLSRGFAEECEGEEYRCLGPACFHGDYIQLVSSENPTSIAVDLRPLEGGRRRADRGDQRPAELRGRPGAEPPRVPAGGRGRIRERPIQVRRWHLVRTMTRSNVHQLRQALFSYTALLMQDAAADDTRRRRRPTSYSRRAPD